MRKLDILLVWFGVKLVVVEDQIIKVRFCFFNDIFFDVLERKLFESRNERCAFIKEVDVVLIQLQICDL